MTATVNIDPQAVTDGITYASSVPLTSTEATLGDGVQVATIIPVSLGQVMVATVQLSINGLVTGNNTYIVMQTDMGDGVWIDVAWLIWTGNQGSATFALVGGGFGSAVYQQSRQSGAFPTPQSNGSSSIPMAGRVRFIGKSIFIGTASSLAGVTTEVSVTIKYKLYTPR